MGTMSSAVARVIRSELGDRDEDIATFAARAGKEKTTAWRHVKGRSRMSIDDVEDYARALGWTLTQLLDAAAAKRDAVLDPEAVAADALSRLDPAAQADIARAAEGLRPKRNPPGREMGREA